MPKIDRFKGQRNIEGTLKYEKSFVDGGKICSQCKEVKSLDKYGKRPQGYQARCKSCMKIYNKKRWARAKHKLW